MRGKVAKKLRRLAKAHTIGKPDISYDRDSWEKHKQMQLSGCTKLFDSMVKERYKLISRKPLNHRIGIIKTCDHCQSPIKYRRKGKVWIAHDGNSLKEHKCPPKKKDFKSIYEYAKEKT